MKMTEARLRGIIILAHVVLVPAVIVAALLFEGLTRSSDEHALARVDAPLRQPH
jgi:hypothetical protein